MTEEIRQVDVKGRSITVRRLKDAQLMVLLRDAQTLEDEKATPARKMNAGRWIMDTFDSLIVNEDDQDYVLALVRAGKVEISDLMVFMTAFTNEAPTTGPEPKKVVRRGRPRKTQPAAE